MEINKYSACLMKWKFPAMSGWWRRAPVCWPGDSRECHNHNPICEPSPAWTRSRWRRRRQFVCVGRPQQHTSGHLRMRALRSLGPKLEIAHKSCAAGASERGFASLMSKMSLKTRAEIQWMKNESADGEITFNTSPLADSSWDWQYIHMIYWKLEPLGAGLKKIKSPLKIIFLECISKKRLL
jgi:hypothetical protein